jgi:hypothetical protein
MSAWLLLRCHLTEEAMRAWPLFILFIFTNTTYVPNWDSGPPGPGSNFIEGHRRTLRHIPAESRERARETSCQGLSNRR